MKVISKKTAAKATLILFCFFGIGLGAVFSSTNCRAADSAASSAAESADSQEKADAGSSASKRKRKKKVALVTPAPEVKIPDSDSCGPGWLVIQKRTLSATTTRQTVNLGGILPTFGMTSGTMGCAQMPLSTLEEAAVKYTYTNMDSLMVAMAEGQGEVLTGFAQTLGCEDRLTERFSKMTQSHFREITNDGQVNGLQLFQNVKTQLKNDPILSTGCPSV